MVIDFKAIREKPRQPAEGAQFTPGPWAVEPRQWDHGASLAIVAPQNGYIVTVVPFDEDIQTVDEPDYETVKRHPDDIPNSNLIAAAPAMYEALLELVICPAFNGQVFERDKESHRAWTLARNAIAQAEGRQGR